MLIERIKLKNLLSFGPEGIDLELRKLNVLIGPNGSGKSNLIDAISLLQAMPRDLTVPIREGGGILDWLWHGDDSTEAVIEVRRWIGSRQVQLVHRVELEALNGQTGVFGELVEQIDDPRNPRRTRNPEPFRYQFANGTRMIESGGRKRELKSNGMDPQQSILSQLRDPDQYKTISFLSKSYTEIAIYRDWAFGGENPVRQPQKTDLLTSHLEPNCRNLVLVLNRLRLDRGAKQELLERMGQLLDGLVDFQVEILGGTARLFLDEGKFLVPANRLSDGTLRYLCLLAVLLDPKPPKLVCIDEPELGLHPDLVLTVGELLVEASERMQLIVTTHSRVLVDALNGRAEDVVVCQRHEDGTQMNRLEKQDMAKWLEKYSLSDLWSSGQIGGNRW
jgi:predicted ATPase